MTSTEKEKRSADTFDGKKNYISWRQRQIALGFTKADAGKNAVRVFELVEGEAADVLTAAMPAELTEFPFATAAEVFAALDEVYGGATAEARATALGKIVRLRQGGTSLEEHLTEWSGLAAAARISGADAVTYLRESLSKTLRGMLAAQEFTSTAALMVAARRADMNKPAERAWNPREGQRQGRRRNRQNGKRGGAATSGAALTEAQKKERDKDIECYNCGKKGHRRADCRQKKGKKAKQEPEEDSGPEWDDEDLMGKD